MAKRKRLRPNLKDYLRTGIVRTTMDIDEVVDVEDEGEGLVIPEKLAKPEVTLPLVSNNTNQEDAEKSQEHVSSKTKARGKRAKLESAIHEAVVSDPKIELRIVEPKPEVTPETEPVIAEQSVVEPTPVVAEDSVSEPVIESKVASPDEVQALLGLLAPEDRQMWEMMISAATEVTHEVLNLDTMREEFQSADQTRFTYYILVRHGRRLRPIRRVEQIAEPVRCILRWDENGAARFSELA